MQRLNLNFELLPGYASFLLKERLDEYAHHQLQSARDMQFPLLKFFEHLGDEQLLALSKQSLTQFFQYIIENRAADQIKDSLEQWRNNMLPLVDKEQIVADDISLTGILRKLSFSKFLKDYTKDVEIAIKILIELDTLNTASELESYRLFLNIQHDKIQHGYNELEERDKLYKQSQALTHIGNWTWMIETGKITWSDELYRIYGLEPQAEEITFERFAQFVHPDDRERRIHEIQQSITTLVAKDYTMRIVTDKGDVRALEGKNEILINAEGKAIGIAGTCRDITAEYFLRKQLEEEKDKLDKANKSLAIKNAALERSNSELSSFSYIASHDLQEPLRKIKTFSSILQLEAPNLSGTVNAQLNKIDSSVSQMQALIRDLLAFSQTHKTLLEQSKVDLEKLLEDVAATFTDNAADKKVTISIGKLPVVNGLSFQLSQLFTNLISNAVKYSKDNDVVVHVNCEKIKGQNAEGAGLSKQKEYYDITVKDNGIGFEPEYKERIFEIFQRLHTKGEYTGTGIGLAICKKIAHNHGGNIVAASILNQGSVFHTYLPCS
jgi:PAS domain S-box-containing protein